MLKIAVVANTPPPYRVPMYSQLATMPGIALHVIFCSRREPNRLWDLPPLDFDHEFLREQWVAMKDRYIHNNIGVIGALRKFKPDIVVTDGFNPTHLYAFLYTLVSDAAHIPMTDGTDRSEEALSAVHRAVRRLVYSRSSAFVSASVGGDRLYQSYGIAADECFKSCLCVDNNAYTPPVPAPQKRYDFIFAGRIEPGKSPLFALEVACVTAQNLGRKTSLLVVGSGSLDKELRRAAAEKSQWVEVEFFGFAAQAQLPELYRSARLFLFPTLADVWGVVANEACAAGLPVLVSPHAGVNGELVRDGENGFICEIDADLWAQRAALLLSQPGMWQEFSARSLALANQYTFANSANGLLDACRLAQRRRISAKEAQGMDRPRRVVIVERQLLHYRTAFYNRLKTLLENEGVELELLFGRGTPAEAMKKDEVTIDWARRIPTHYLLGNRVCWQPFGDYARGADLVVVMHENKLLYNLWLLSFGRPRRLAFWGHGRNMQSNKPTGLKERFKRWTVNKVDWWFAYTRSSAELVNQAGFPSDRTTVVQNAVDTSRLSHVCSEISSERCRALRVELGLGNGPVGLYLGSLYREKRLDFLLDAAREVRKRVPNFQLLVAGAGPMQDVIESAAADEPWIHYLGPLKGNRKAEILVLADVMLNPGLVGLAILDSFASGTPMFTTDCDLHSPEISYLESGHNGVMTDDDLHAYSSAVSNILLDRKALAELKRGALGSAPFYTIENMAERICNGILQCLDLPSGRMPEMLRR
jgi:glycosyltransferase involved in cell wall biosynthesis